MGSRNRTTLHLRFEEWGTSTSGRTLIFKVSHMRTNVMLGQIRWYAPWRKYVFYPNEGTLWSESCLTEVNEFLHRCMVEHRS